VQIEQRRAWRALDRSGDRQPALVSDVLMETIRVSVRDEFDPIVAKLDELVAATDAVLTMHEAATVLRVSPKTVLKWIRTRDLPASRIGLQWRFRRSALMQWIGEQKHVQ
jgi:excisionase family DNA binding protein